MTIGLKDLPEGRRAKFLFGALVVMTCIALGACGRKGPPHPPEGEEANYTYPKFYPNTEDTLAPRRSAAPAPAASEEAIEDELGEVEEEERDVTLEESYQPVLGKPKPGYRFEGDGYARSRSLTY
ncbi:MAG: lipoprotein [Kiloniellales bacterium]|nr:lipoprotein [Kiloniellales bacterium]